MKNSILSIAFSLLCLVSFAQKGQGWAELSDMRMVMSQTFPPMLKNNDLAPAKQNAAELYEKAIALQNSTKPRAFRSTEMSEKFVAITSNAKVMKDLVASKASDEDIKNSLVVLHGAFAEIAHHKKAGMGKGRGQGAGMGKM